MLRVWLSHSMLLLSQYSFCLAKKPAGLTLTPAPSLKSISYRGDCKVTSKCKILIWLPQQTLWSTVSPATRPQQPGPFPSASLYQNSALSSFNRLIQSQPRNPKSLYPQTSIKACTPDPTSIFSINLPWPPRMVPQRVLCTSSMTCE